MNPVVDSFGDMDIAEEHPLEELGVSPLVS